ncbi:MAG: hypothetical protein HQM10_21475 [Candidatus Riflebacteria bacterium]|nr:hypothetical protein [Candidatus Riflebacteria bacterium]
MNEVLNPFLQLSPANVILFADGCVDSSASLAGALLPGKNHLVLSTNDTYEICNYRLSLQIAKTWGCKYVALFQDDDIYDMSIFNWLNYSLKLLEFDRKLAIIGGNGGGNMGKTPPVVGDEGLKSAVYEPCLIEGKNGFRLGKYEEILVPVLEKKVNDFLLQYVAVVNRAPQIIRISAADELNFFPEALEPYQYDDYHNCFSSWLKGYKILLMPFRGKKCIFSEGGMRLFNSVTVNSRPEHFIHNWNHILNKFGDAWNSGEIMHRVNIANREDDNFPLP